MGYLASATANLIALWIIAHVVEWGWPAFVTAELDGLMGIITVSMLAAVAADLLWFWRDPPPLRHGVQVLLNAITFVVMVRTWQVFPFDFTGYADWWETATRVLLGVGIFGVITDTITQLVKLARDVTPA